MLSLDTLYPSLLLPAAGVLAFAVSGGSSNAPVNDRERETLRVRNSVRVITESEEGFPLERLPGGVYGFSYSPASDALPLFATRTVAAFEIHKPAASSPQILGYVTEKVAAAMETGDLQDISLYPEAHGDSRILIAIPSDRIVRAKGPSRSDGNYLTMTVR